MSVASMDFKVFHFIRRWDGGWCQTERHEHVYDVAIVPKRSNLLVYITARTIRHQLLTVVWYTWCSECGLFDWSWL